MRKGEVRRGLAVFLAAGLIVVLGGCTDWATAQDGSGQREPGGGAGWWTNVLNRTKKLATARLKGTEDETGETEETDVQGTRFRAAKNYEELLAAVSAGGSSLRWEMNQLDFAEGVSGGMLNDNVAAEDGAAESTAPAGKDYSDTNVQVEGIAEADIVKTDGEYIYILSKGEETSEIFIVRAQDGEISPESSFSLTRWGSTWKEEMYVSGNHLVIVRQGWKEPDSAPEPEEDGYYIDRWFGYYTVGQTQILIYDITDRKAPVLAAEHVQDGDYVTSREKDGYLYVVSEKGLHYNYILYMDWGFVDAVVPEGTQDAPDQTALARTGKESCGEELSQKDRMCLPQADGALLAPDRIYFCEQNQNSAYTIVTAICLEEPKKLADGISFMADSEHCYMSGNAIYLAAYDWRNYDGREFDETDIVKIAYEDGKLSLAAQGKVKGNLDDQFSMDEKDGYLRIVTTVNHYGLVQEKDYSWRRYLGRSNSLYVLDMDLRTVGSLENLAEDEMVYSVRFLGDTAYFVTFRNTDPLFSVDVSDPEHPVLLGALKIPGFSDYLHPYGENLLLGIGYDAGETGAINCVKLTMFDISDPLGVVEKHTLLLDDYYTSEACTNHRAVLVDEGRALIGLPLEGYSYGDGKYPDYAKYAEIKAYEVYGYDEGKGFYRRLERKYVKEWEKGYDYEDWNDWYRMRLRGIYIGDYFYLVSPGREVLSWRMGQEVFSEAAMWITGE